MALKSKQHLNILILGETGVGKSTWINSFMNCLTYNSLEIAEKNKLLNPIHSQFIVSDENFEEITVNTGSEINEKFGQGAACTQQAKVHSFNYKNLFINLIDTPGVGDTRGLVQDEKNFKNILEALSEFEEIHGICILLKPNHARLNLMFQFCIKELLTFLHKDAAKNIVLCFTNSRSTFYRPGDTLLPLRTLITSNKFPIAINKNTIYCFDSEAYRFLAAIKNVPPVKFSKMERASFIDSWKKSTEETKRVLQYISKLTPHPIKNTLDLNNSRALVCALVSPLAENANNIERNKVNIKHQQKVIENTKASLIDFEKQLMTSVTVLVHEKLPHPMTVCANINCVEYVGEQENQRMHYKQICHQPCSLQGIPLEVQGHPQLLGCACINGNNCKFCGHSYEDHLHKNTKSVKRLAEVENKQVAESLSNCKTDKEKQQVVLQDKENVIKEMENESNVIQTASVKFAIFLKNNAITPYNDVMEDYLNMLLRQEKGKIPYEGQRNLIEALEMRKQSYKLEKDILEESMNSAKVSETVTSQQIQQIVSDLLALKHCGRAFETSVENILNKAKSLYK